MGAVNRRVAAAVSGLAAFSSVAACVESFRLFGDPTRAGPDGGDGGDVVTFVEADGAWRAAHAR